MTSKQLKQWDKEEAARAAAKLANAKKYPLPDGILESDTTYPDYKKDEKIARDEDGYSQLYFELWYTQSMGWVIPTLLISRAGRRAPANTTDRTYATTLDGRACRVGRGPHVLRTVTIYVRENRVTALQKYIDLRKQGQVTSNQIRDRISSRRAQGQVMRAEGRRSWRWDI